MSKYINGVRQKDTDWLDTSYQDWHRLCGRKILATDVDMFEFTYQDGIPVPISMVDLKAVRYGFNNKPIILSRSSIQANKFIADKLEIPFFIIITFMTKEYDIPMMFVVPANEKASEWRSKVKAPAMSVGPMNGLWMNPRQHCQMLYALRGLSMPEEVGKLHSNQFTTYQLPIIKP